MSEVVVSAAVTQAVTGHVIGTGETHPCCRCGQLLRDGDPIRVYACRCVEAAVWAVPRVSCQNCGPDTVETPTLGVIEAVLEGRLCLRTDGARQETALLVVAEQCLALFGAVEGTG